MNISITPNHAPSVVTWALRLATHPVLGPWLLDDAHRFAAFYATLQGRMVWPDSLKAAIKGEGASGTITVQEQTYQEWRKNPDHPFSGRLSSKFLEAFWEGSVVYRFTQHHAEEWQGILKAVANQWNDQHAAATDDESDRRLLLQKLDGTDSPTLAETSDASVTDRSVRLPNLKNSVPLFALNALFINSLLHLSPAELSVLEMSFLLRDDEGFRMWWNVLSSDAHDTGSILQAMLAINADTLDEVVSPLGTLAGSQMVKFTKNDRDVLPMSPFWHDWFVEPPVNEADLFTKLAVPVRKQTNAGALARFAVDDRETVEALLRPSMSDEKGVNVLIYGAKSIDKQSLVVDTITSLGLSGYTLASRIPDEDLPSACFIVQRYLAKIAPEAIFVVPKADGVLARTQRGQRQMLFFTVEIDDEAVDNPAEHNLLLDNPVKSVWLVHSPERLSEENLGRFLYTCEVKTASRAERRSEVADALKGLGLSPEFFAELSQHTQLGEQQLKSAARLAELVSKPRLSDDELVGYRKAKEAFDVTEMSRSHLLIVERTLENPGDMVVLKEKLVRRAVEQSQKALNRREREDLRQPITEYSLDLLNTGGGFSVPQIITSLKNRPSASLCFWGVPGTGKTQLAEHIAVAIDKPILIKRASDLLDKYVGESEKRISAMFMEARDEDAVLLLDEADTFLRDRSLARYGHEVGMVNELLQGMERFNGVFVCTTNLFKQLDAAALRRFTFKLQFLPLTPEQRWRMFVTESGVNVTALPDGQQEQWQDQLDFMPNLAPGDFATVKRQAVLLGIDLTPAQWLVQLEEEMKAKSQSMSLI